MAGDEDLDLELLEEQREAVSRDKADLFDFYHENWKRLLARAKSMEETLEEIRQQGLDW